ncbi:hypothetical protein ACLK14_18225 [Escherichia coli]
MATTGRLIQYDALSFYINEGIRSTQVNGQVIENMPRNFFNILRDNPESWGGKENPLTLPTTRSSDKAQKSSATVKISAVRFLCYKSLPESRKA